METDVIIELSVLVVVIAIMCYLYYNGKKNRNKDDEQTDEPLLINCPICNAEISRCAPVCPKCGHPIYHINPQNIIIQSSKSNGMGVAGFVLAILSWVFLWTPPLAFILWFFGILFSTIGLFKRPRGLAVAGFIMTTIVIVIAIIFILFSGIGIAALMNNLTI